MSEPSSSEIEQLTAGMTVIWNENRPQRLSLLAELGEIADRALDGTLSGPVRENARNAAHRLAGSAGTFGFHEASSIAQQLERALDGNDPLDSETALLMDEWVTYLRHKLSAVFPPTD